MEKRDEEYVYKNIVKIAKKDPNIIGLILSGSRGKGKQFVTKNSDYDTFIVVKDGVLKEYKKKVAKYHNEKFDLWCRTISNFRKREEDWTRYSYSHIKAVVDKTKEIQKIINEKAKIPKKELKKFIEGRIDGYINSIYRSLKCWRNNNNLGARLEANRITDMFFDAVFALHDRRSTPYYKYLEWDLKKFPLKKLKLSNNELLSLITDIIDKADIKSQQRLLIVSEKMFRKEWYGKVFDSWPDLEWMKTYKK